MYSVRLTRRQVSFTVDLQDYFNLTGEDRVHRDEVEFNMKLVVLWTCLDSATCVMPRLPAREGQVDETNG